MSQLQTPLSKVKGLGSAKDGTSHFWHQRLTALLLIPLVLWLGFSLAALPGQYGTLVGWLQQTPVATLLILSIFTIFYHAQLGIQIVIEDYVSNHATRTICIILNSFVCLVAGITGIVSVLKITFGA
jgi:succinate dehydrogenase / fumarate reductase, membrane anchor subunit